MAKKTTTPKVDTIRHQDRRSNIPTEELRDFVADKEQNPQKLFYPRDPSLDPQLVWRGKDQQDLQDLVVPVVPIYIQEKIHPQAIIDDLLAHAARPGHGLSEDEVGYQLQLFADFDGAPVEFDQKVEFYQHDQNWSNRLILGDSLLVMASLAEKEGLRGKVQTIYMDPPYGIKFGSNWQVSTRKRDVKDGKAEDATRQPEQVRAFRDTWKLGIHSYLTYLRDRLVVSLELLSDSGSVFVQIGEENVHLVRCLMDEVFGSENFVSQIVYRTKNMTFGAKYLETIADFILWYAKDKEHLKYRQLYREMETEGDGHWNLMEFGDGHRETMTGEQVDSHKLLPESIVDICQLGSLYPAGINASGLFSFIYRGRKYTPPPGKSWKTNENGIRRAILANRLEPYQGGETVRYVMKEKDYPISTLPSLWHDTPPPSDKTYVVQTSDKIIQRCVLMTTDPGDLVLDPTCGSGTTAYISEQWGRRWITCDTSRVALALARTRLMAAKYPYYLLVDSSEGIQKETELTGKRPPEYKTESDIKKGFVYKRVPHITLKSIANNQEIDAIHVKWQEQLELLRAQINQTTGMNWQEWEIPRELPLTLTQGMREQAVKMLADWCGLRRERQIGIDTTIAYHADTETLFDRPYEDNKRVRVCGPFSVESLSPHRVLSTADENMNGSVSEPEAHQQQDFATMILDNLKKAGVQNTRKAERLVFDRLDSYAGAWLQAAGEYTDADGKTKRVAVTIGPEHGTVGPQQVKEAAKEAVQGVGFDMLIVCGFAFDPHVAEEIKRYGTLTVLPAKMNPDLAMGDELLKKTGAGNLFMVFGEPDVEINKQKDGQIVIEIKGVDVYDPTTGQIRNASTDDIACWFIDTDYDGESFFVRHAYFTGAEEPYDKLKRALRAEIDEGAWSALYSTISRPFARPASGKIAVKVINHYGDEVLKVFGV